MSLPPFNSRSFVSAMMAILFAVLFVSSVVLFIAPSGRMARDTGWAFLGLDRRDWGDIHTSFGMLFLAMAVWHLVSNWRALMNHIRHRLADPAARLPFTLKPEPIIALLLCLFILIATLKNYPPVSTLFEGQDFIKAYWQAPDPNN